MDTFIHYGHGGVDPGGAGCRAAAWRGTERRSGRAHRRDGGLGHRRSADDRAHPGRIPRARSARISPFFVPASIINMISGHVSIRYGFTGPNMAIVTACTTGLHCIGEAGRLIEYGDADVMVAGGAEGTVSPLGVGGFAAARALSTRNDDPKTASRPWDKDRDGFVLGEGAGVVVLEEYEHARRAARIYAELAGFGMGADAFHMTAPNVDGPKRSMRRRCATRGINADGGAVPQRPRHQHAAGRRERDQRHQAGLRRPRAQEAGGQLHQVDDRPPAGRRRRHRVGLHRAGHCTTRSRRRPSTSSTRTPSATWTTAPTRRGR
jgi:3-oxoacyl-[acyl-carrier-protein] synthase II